MVILNFYDASKYVADETALLWSFSVVMVYALSPEGTSMSYFETEYDMGKQCAVQHNIILPAKL